MREVWFFIAAQFRIEVVVAGFVVLRVDRRTVVKQTAVEEQPGIGVAAKTDWRPTRAMMPSD